MKAIQLNDNEIKLVKEALTNNSVQYASQACDKENIELMGAEWSKNLTTKSDGMITLLNKINNM